MRSFHALNLVTLPRLDVLDALALAPQLLAEVKARDNLPEPIKKAAKDVKRCHGSLDEATARQLTVAVDGGPRAQEADRELDAKYRALDLFLNGWQTLGESAPEAQKAARVRAAVFPDGLKFTQLPFKRQWAASHIRVKHLKDEGLDDVVRELGGGSILEALFKAHQVYGVALGITTASQEADSSAVRPSYEALLDSIRRYIVVVCASVAPGDHEAEELAERLLRPIGAWPSRPVGDASASDASEGDSPEPPAEPSPAAPQPAAPSAPEG